MKQTLKITVRGKIQGIGYRDFVQKSAQKLGIEGTVQNNDDGTVTICAGSAADALDSFIDQLYKGPKESKVEEVSAEPLIGGKNFRGVFRVLGE